MQLISPYERKILECDENPQTNKQTYCDVTISAEGMQSLIYACRLRQLNSIEGCLTCHHELTHDIRFYDNHQGSMTSTRLRTLIAQWP